MIKFEEHDDNLFRMLEEPVPLTDDAELPVLVRLIQDDTMLGKANKRSCHPDTLSQKIICSSSNLTDDGLFMDGNYTYCYEIIGTLVEEGSAEWALYQMMQGKKVCNPALAASSWISDAHHYSWQIYKESKPELQYKVGDWVEFIDAGGHKSQGKYLSKAYDNAILVRDITYNTRCVVPTTKVIRKLSPADMVIHIGCMSGTVRPVSINGIHVWFQLISVDDKIIATIRISSLDAHTRELVESLLKAQEEK